MYYSPSPEGTTIDVNQVMTDPDTGEQVQRSYKVQLRNGNWTIIDDDLPKAPTDEATLNDVKW